MTLYVAGDSFATVDKNQSEGTSWSELIATSLGCKLINVAIPGASNGSILTQIDWILDRCDSDDYIVVFLTDRYRRILPNTIEKLDRKKFLEYHGLHKLQKTIPGIDYSKKILLKSSLMIKPEHKDFFSKYFNPDLQQFEDEYMLTGAFTKIFCKTKKLLVCSGGYDNSSSRFGDVPDKVNPELFCLPADNFIDLPATQMLKFGKSREYVNHLDLQAHAKVARVLYKQLLRL
jgi:hypothetical protein